MTSASDAIMMDSPAQTPDPKGQFSAPPGPPPVEVSADVLMAVDNQPSESAGWDTRKWREELQFVTSRLQHPQWIPCKDLLDGRLADYLRPLHSKGMCADMLVEKYSK